MTRVTVTAAPDHLDRLIGSPRTGLLELIWNALDADASDVHVDLDVSGLGGIVSLTVRDNGEGISADRAETLFQTLGGSWKKLATATTGGRALHGRQGGGRFAAYGLGQDVSWTSFNRATTGMKEISIRGSRASAQEFDIEVADSNAEETGTEVRIGTLTDATMRYLDSDRVGDELTAALAIYLLKYHPHVFWREKELDPAGLISERTEYEVAVEHDGATLSIPVTLIEWRTKFDRALYLCDADGTALYEMSPGIQAPGATFTAYVRWDGFSDRIHDLTLEGAAAEPVPAIIEAAKEKLRDHYKQRSEERYSRVIEKWKREDSYPFRGNSTEPVEVAKRDLFDLVAIHALPAVEDADPASRKLSLRLLREAVETSPGAVHAIMQEVLNLSEAEAEELRVLIEKTSLAGIISAAKLVADRLEFLASLEAIINEPDLKKVVKERSQLHRILVNETWVFREEYALTGDDQTLRTVLRQHLAMLGAEGVTMDDVDAQEVFDESGAVRVIDLMLSKVIPQSREHREHLVIELKRPSVHIGLEEIGQIENYAMTVAGDTRFAATDTRWEFWIVGDNMAPSASIKANQARREPGITMETDTPVNLVVRAVTWAQVIRNAKHRLQFVKDSLDYDPSTEAGLDYLRAKHAEFLPDLLKAPPAIEGGPTAGEATDTKLGSSADPAPTDL